jgi:hypothetical protein
MFTALSSLEKRQRQPDEIVNQTSGLSESQPMQERPPFIHGLHLVPLDHPSI